MNRAFSKIAILIIFLVIIIGGIFAWQYFGVLKEKIKDKTADWQTYKNEQYGFAFKYPENWSAIENTLPQHPYLVSVTLGPKATIQQGGVFGVAVRNQTEAEYLSSLEQEGFYIINQSDTTLGDKKATFYTFGRTGSSGIQWKEVVAQKDDFLLDFSKGATPDYDDIFNQILSSFKFLEEKKLPQIDTSQWNVYQNEKYEYEIKYPPELKIMESGITPIEKTTIMMWKFPSVKSDISASISVSVSPKSGGSLLSELIYDPNFCKKEEDPLSAKIYCETNYRLLPVAGAAYQKDSNAFIVLLLVQGPEDLTKADLTEEINIYEEMLSTFKFIEIKQTPTEEVKPAGKKLIEEIPTSLMPLGRNDSTRLLRVKMAGAALRVYFGEYQKYPTRLSEVQYLISGDNADDILKDPATKEFFEYSSLLGGKDYQLCVNYDAIGKECYNPKDF